MTNFSFKDKVINLIEGIDIQVTFITCFLSVLIFLIIMRTIEYTETIDSLCLPESDISATVNTD